MKQALYDTYDYPRYWRGREYEDQAEKIALGKFLAKIPASSQNTLIDIGGGFGRLAKVYSPIFKKCLLVDPSKRLLAQAKIQLKNFPKIKLQEGRVEKIPAGDGQFDVALLIRLVHHLPDPYPAFLEASRVLKPKGFLVLEFANKIHFLACLRAWLKPDLNFTKSLVSVSQSSARASKKTQIPFFNHHPNLLKKKLEKAGFKILDSLSVSNFRSPLIKKIIPLRTLLFIESRLQPFASRFYFGPSIFLLCQKTKILDK